MRAETPPRARSPRSSAGMTLVSLTTSASPGRRRSGRSRTLRSASAAPGLTTSSRAASRGRAGRSAIRSSGRSKSKRSTFMKSSGRPAGRRGGSLIYDRRRGRASAARPTMIRMTGQSRSQLRPMSRRKTTASATGGRRSSATGDLAGHARLAAIDAPGVAEHDGDRNEQEQRPPVARERIAEIAEEEDAPTPISTSAPTATPRLRSRSRRRSPFG